MKTIKYISTGLAFGFICTVLFSITFLGLNEITSQYLAWLIASALYGMSSMIFEIKSLNQLCISAIHYLACLAITSINVYIFYTEYLVSVFICFTLSYILIYIIMWLVAKRQTEDLNNALKQKNNH